VARAAGRQKRESLRGMTAQALDIFGNKKGLLCVV
jgi:hypothetical protein